MYLQKEDRVGFSQNTIGLMEMFSRSSNSSSICMAWIEFNRKASKLALTSIDSGATPIICDNSSRQNEINSSSESSLFMIHN